MSLNPKKSLGQHFLRDALTAQQIVENLRGDSNSVVIEIGPGEGVLTQYLVQRFKDVIAIEIDDRAIEQLQRKFPTLTVVHGDFLTVDLTSIIQSYKGRSVYVIGNIPYYITSPILFRLFELSTHLTQAVIMMQKEVAERLVADPRTKAYGILTVQTNLHTEAQLTLDVSKEQFYPVPKVDSSVVSFAFKQIPSDLDFHLFTRILRTAFNQRRKKLSNALKSLNIDAQKDLPFQSKRAEELSVEDFITLTKLLS